MKFHPLYAGRFAMGLDELGPEQPGIIATQSTHKQLASFSQASQIHVRDSHIEGQRRRIEHRRFNEFFMLHASTSPFYPLFASLDVGAQMMKGRSGEVLWDDTIRLGIELRKKVRAIRREFEDKESDSGAALVLRAVRARSARRRAGATCRGRTCRPTSWPRDAALLGAGARRTLARLQPCGARLCHHRSQQADRADAGLRPRDGRLCRPRHPRAGGGAVSAREPGRAGEERPQFAAVPADARRGIEQGRHAAERAGRLQEAARRQCPARRRDRRIRAPPTGALRRRAAARSVRRDARLLPRQRREHAAARAVRARASAGRR